MTDFLTELFQKPDHIRTNFGAGLEKQNKKESDQPEPDDNKPTTDQK